MSLKTLFCFYNPGFDDFGASKHRKKEKLHRGKRKKIKELCYGQLS